MAIEQALTFMFMSSAKRYSLPLLFMVKPSPALCTHFFEKLPTIRKGQCSSKKQTANVALTQQLKYEPHPSHDQEK